MRKGAPKQPVYWNNLHSGCSLAVLRNYSFPLPALVVENFHSLHSAGLRLLFHSLHSAGCRCFFAPSSRLHCDCFLIPSTQLYCGCFFAPSSRLCYGSSFAPSSQLCCSCFPIPSTYTLKKQTTKPKPPNNNLPPPQRFRANTPYFDTQEKQESPSSKQTIQGRF